MADSVPSSGPAAWTGLFATVAPTMAPTMAPVAAVVQQQQNSNLLPWLNFCVYVLFTFLLLGLMVYINSKKNPSLMANRDRTTIVSVRTLAVLNAQQHVDQVQNMTQEDRIEYVTSILKTQKFVDPNDKPSKPGSFRRTPPSHKDDSDVESTASCSSSDEHPSCAICLDRFQGGDDICAAQNKECPHEFHLECIFPWLLKSPDCPCCRRDYLAVENGATDGTDCTNANGIPGHLDV